jgi:hypothetical protein
MAALKKSLADIVNEPPPQGLLAALRELESAPLQQWPEIVKRAASPQQLTALSAVLSLDPFLLHESIEIELDTIAICNLWKGAMLFTEWMNGGPTNREQWIGGARQLLEGRGMLHSHKTKCRALRDHVARLWQVACDDVHAVFVLPEVERLTDLLPELVGIIGEFLSECTNPAEYVSIHALPKQSQPSATGGAGGSGSSSPFPAGQPEADGSGPSGAPSSGGEAKETSTTRMDESE